MFVLRQKNNEIVEEKFRNNCSISTALWLSFIDTEGQ